MALIKEVQYKGFTSNYWKIMKTTEDVIANRTSVRMGLYKDQDARTEGIGNTLLNQSYDLDGIDKTRASIYSEIKLLPDFEGAIDS
jgi:hypothetical protein